MHEDKNWRAKYIAYLEKMGKNAHKVTRLNFHGFGMNMGIWHYEEGKLLEKFVNLEAIDLSENYIDTVVFDFSKFPHLKEINLAGNALYYWGQEGSFRIHEQVNAPKLEKLDLSEGLMGHVILSQEAPFRDTLKWLDLSGNHFSNHSLHGEVPPKLQMTNLPKLEFLGLRDNCYTYCPKLRWLTNLQVLDLSMNPIRSGWEELLKMPQLRTLILRSCSLERIPRPFYEMGILEKLDLRFNRIPENEIEKLREALPGLEVLAVPMHERR